MTSVTIALLNLDEATNKLFVGNSNDGEVRAERVAYSPEEWDASPDATDMPSHTNLGLYSGARWRFPEDSNTVFWWTTPGRDDKEAVNEYLAKRGFTGLRHLALSDYGNSTAGESEYAHGIAHETPNRFRAKGRVRGQ